MAQRPPRASPARAAFAPAPSVRSETAPTPAESRRAWRRSAMRFPPLASPLPRARKSRSAPASSNSRVRQFPCLRPFCKCRPLRRAQGQGSRPSLPRLRERLPACSVRVGGPVSRRPGIQAFPQPPAPSIPPCCGRPRSPGRCRASQSRDRLRWKPSGSRAACSRFASACPRIHRSKALRARIQGRRRLRQKPGGTRQKPPRDRGPCRGTAKPDREIETRVCPWRVAVPLRSAARWDSGGSGKLLFDFFIQAGAAELGRNAYGVLDGVRVRAAVSDDGYAAPPEKRRAAVFRISRPFTEIVKRALGKGVAELGSQAALDGSLEHSADVFHKPFADLQRDIADEA